MKYDCNLPAALLLSGATLVGCMSADERFTQMDGFDAVLDIQLEQQVTDRERVLLEKYRPQLYISADQPGPLDFYADYIAAGCLTSNTAPEDCAVDQADLNAVKYQTDAVFTHMPSDAPTTAVGYGGIYRGTMQLVGLTPEQRPWLFLRYNFAFRHSGISAGISNWQQVLLALVGNLDDWHQLDHYTAAIIALDEHDEPVAVMLQQHNYLHTYLVGTDPAFPRGGPFRISVAQRSNEFYPYRAEPTAHRTVSFLSKDNVAWMADGGAAPLLATMDETADTLVDYELQVLNPDDAFYVFAGRLGARRYLPGRDGPPGAIYYTLPQMWRFEDTLALFYWEEPDPDFVALMQSFSYSDPLSILPQQKKRLTTKLVEYGLVE